MLLASKDINSYFCFTLSCNVQVAFPFGKSRSIFILLLTDNYFPTIRFTFWKITISLFYYTTYIGTWASRPNFIIDDVLLSNLLIKKSDYTCVSFILKSTYTRIIIYIIQKFGFKK